MTEPNDDLALILDALRTEIERTGRSWRKMEIALNLGNGYFSHLFAGRIELKFRHIVAITEVLGLTTRDFFLRAYEVTPRIEEPNLRSLLQDVVKSELDARGLARQQAAQRQAAAE
jgi:hypothetical protein